MSLVCVPTVRTTFSMEDLTRSLIKAWYDIYQDFPKKQSVGVIYAQWALETGEGKSCWCENIGNYKAVDEPNKTIKYCMLNNVWEIINGKKEIFQPPNKATWFMAFDSIDEGVAWHLNSLKTKRFKPAWRFVENGDIVGFVKQIKTLNYFTASLDDYLKATGIYFSRFMKDQTFEKVLADLQTPKVVELTPVEIVADPPAETIPPKEEPIVNVENRNIWQTIIELIMKVFK